MAYDRFELQLPPAETGSAPLGDALVARDVAGWLWQFGPTPIVALIEQDGDLPAWLSPHLTLSVPWKDGSAAALLLEERSDLEQFLLQGAPHEHTHLLWPRVSPAKTFEALCAGGSAWESAVDGHARMSEPEVMEVFQLQPV